MGVHVSKQPIKQNQDFFFMKDRMSGERKHSEARRLYAGDELFAHGLLFESLHLLAAALDSSFLCPANS